MQIQKPRQGYKFVKSFFGKYEEIPEEWEIKKLETLVDVLDSQRIPIEESERGKRHGIYPYYGASGLIDYIDDYLFDEKILCLAEDGENLRSRVLPIAFTVTGKSWINNHAHVLRPTQINHNYLEFFLNRMSLLKYIASTAQPKLTQKDMRSIPIVRPLLSEQQKIASILSNVDSLIQQTQKEIEQTRKLKKGLMQKLLTKGIGHTKFKKIIWLFGKEIQIPEMWEIKKLENIVDILDSRRIPVEESERGRRHGKYPYYGASGIIDYIDDYIFDETLLCLAEDGENLRSRVLPIAFTIKGKTWVNNHAHVLKTKETTDHYFLEYFLNNLSFLKYIASTAQPKLNQKDMRSIPVICQDKSEQQKIASILSNVDSQIQKQQEYKSKLENLKKGLMQKLLTGQIRVKV
jgi:type I restriction enzyme S subunit